MFAASERECPASSVCAPHRASETGVVVSEHQFATDYRHGCRTAHRGGSPAICNGRPIAWLSCEGVESLPRPADSGNRAAGFLLRALSGEITTISSMAKPSIAEELFAQIISGDAAARAAFLRAMVRSSPPFTVEDGWLDFKSVCRPT